MRYPDYFEVVLVGRLCLFLFQLLVLLQLRRQFGVNGRPASELWPKVGTARKQQQRHIGLKRPRYPDDSEAILAGRVCLFIF